MESSVEWGGWLVSWPRMYSLPDYSWVYVSTSSLAILVSGLLKPQSVLSPYIYQVTWGSASNIVQDAKLDTMVSVAFPKVNHSWGKMSTETEYISFKTKDKMRFKKKIE